MRPEKVGTGLSRPLYRRVQTRHTSSVLCSVTPPYGHPPERGGPVAVPGYLFLSPRSQVLGPHHALGAILNSYTAHWDIYHYPQFTNGEVEALKG